MILLITVLYLTTTILALYIYLLKCLSVQVVHKTAGSRDTIINSSLHDLNYTSSIYLSTHMSFYLSICTGCTQDCRITWYYYYSVYLSTHLSSYLNICLSVQVVHKTAGSRDTITNSSMLDLNYTTSVYLSTHMSIYLPINLSVQVVHKTTDHVILLLTVLCLTSTSSSVYLSTHMSFYLYRLYTRLRDHVILLLTVLCLTSTILCVFVTNKHLSLQEYSFYHH